ncbi:MAG TPA: glycine--tRNA ligase subunit beta, partial [Deltaproteobacteria bacterium]|nr:glycine--tRNA ligase subunit beta [Deltaproteobacteria bacterium]
MGKLLLEIRTEEIPAGYIELALDALSSFLLKRLNDKRVSHGNATTYGTPRRLAVEIEGVAQKQTPVTVEVMGPPQRLGFDEDGSPTLAARKFAEKVGLPLGKIKIKDTRKGCYLYAEKTEKGLSTKTLLKEMLPEAIMAVPFPKTMRWADLHIQFARPIQSILALLGKDVISFRLENLKSGRFTYGHSFMAPGRIKISTPEEYSGKLRSAYVLADIQERKQRVEKEIEKAVTSVGGDVLPDGELMDIVKNLIEYPAVVTGRFDDDFLELPREILITAMREHQKYFAVIDRNNNLMPYFIAVNNTQAKDMELVARGHERVLRARLKDAQFFYQCDLQDSVEKWLEKLNGVLFQAQLGSMAAKVERIRQLTGYLADRAGIDADTKLQALRAAELSKTDLVSQVVGEFPKLQGIMGRVYASVKGEGEAVAAAIEEHYRPTYSGGALPETDAGALLAISDKLDTICGCFNIGLIPTGTSDPYALRRQGIGVVQIMLDKHYTFSLRDAVNQSLSYYGGERAPDNNDTTDKVMSFIRSRVVQLLADDGYPKDVISAVVAISLDPIPNVWNRVEAL